MLVNFHYLLSTGKMSLGTKNSSLFFLVLLLNILSFKSHFSEGSDFIAVGQSLSGNRTISSDNGTFELGFFTPGKSQNYYIGIWYKRFPNKLVVWVANRNQPISDPYGSQLQLLDGNLVLLNESKNQIWSTNSTSRTTSSVIAMLLDDGNFVITRESNSSDIIWQSFDYPTDTWLPRHGKIGYNKIRHEKMSLTSWRNSENPAPSPFSVEVDQNGPSINLVYNGTNFYWSSGRWTGITFLGVPEVNRGYYITNYTYVSNENESKFTYITYVPNSLTRFMIDVTGQFRQLVWQPNLGWIQFWAQPAYPCLVYGYCGAFGICSRQKQSVCNCMRGYEPRVMKNWELEDYTDGCTRTTPLTDKFFSMQNLLFSANSESLDVENAKECEVACLSKSTCSAYAFDSNQCLVWTGEVYNVEQLASDDKRGRIFYVRTAKSAEERKTASNIWIIVGAIGGLFIFIGVVVLVIIRRRKQKVRTSRGTVEDTLMVFKYKEIRKATRDFSEKLGEGGFGSVFRGTLPNSRAIAVKSLNTSTQGEKQFCAEVNTIGLVQHINLIRLLGFCIEGTKRFLVYDYMKNGSLGSYLFRKDSDVFLDWKARYNIMIGVARGLVYLHEECRNCIIHCDIKPDNILLDDEFSPKVADFGLAKLLGRDFSRVLTTLRGTIGYLAPEWISGDPITAKADVFSYGMLLFEIISGKRNRDGTDDYIPAQVAQTINEGGKELMLLLDQRLQGNVDLLEFVRACKVACWCIQDDEKDRPSMGLVVKILEGISEVGNPPIPRFFSLSGFGEYKSQPFNSQTYTSETTSSISLE